MDEKELENKIRKALEIDPSPDRAQFSQLLSILKDPVTKKQNLRYNKQTIKSKIINSKITTIIDSLWSKRLVLFVPSFIIILLIFVGSFTLSPLSRYGNSNLVKIAEQDETLEASGFDYDDSGNLADLNEPAIDDLSNLGNEI